MSAPSEHEGQPRFEQSGSNARDWLNTIVTIAGIVALYFIVPVGRHDPLPLAVATTLALVIACVLAVLISRRVIRILDGRGDDRLRGPLTLLASVIMAFSMVYYLLAQSDPGQIAGLETRLDALYFTLTTLATIGYGDIHPAGQAARAITCVQVVFNAIFLAGLVRATLYQAKAVRAARRQS